MKKYISPEFELNKFLTSDIMTLSLFEQDEDTPGTDQIDVEVNWVPKS